MPLNSTLTLPLYDSHALPEHPYVHTPNVYSALVQLYARPRRLDPASMCLSCLGHASLWCRFGCNCLKTAYNIFVECCRFAETHDRTICASSRSETNSPNNGFECAYRKVAVRRRFFYLARAPILTHSIECLSVYVLESK
ncbi:hypothetical protein EDB19DRAFT_567714 [Suillus lakei]|nr:hypothetical protein EDB19DRAFT_567714 [Suillus lakei]